MPKPDLITTGCPVSVAGEELILLGARAAWWKAASTLLIADTHFGKAAAFRAGGLPVPEATTQADLHRLSAALRATGAERLVILGDVLHARSGVTEVVVEQLAAWRDDHAELDIAYVPGNHDRRAGDIPSSWRMTHLPEGFRAGPFEWRHEPPADPLAHAPAYVLSGHIHPMIVFRERIGPGLRCPCFIFEQHHAILPAFSAFTGRGRTDTTSQARIYAISPTAEVTPVATP